MRIIESFRASLGDSDEEALAEGYLLGNKERFSEKLSEAVRRAGLAHLVAVSGFHLVALIGLPLKRLRRVSRLFALIMSVLCVIIFVLIVGMSASLFRASMVFGLQVIFWYFGRKINAVRLVIYVLAITLFVNPFSLLDIGWQYSFLAYVGITIVLPEIRTFFYGKDIPGGVKETLLAGIVIQVLTFPVSIYNFGQVSLVGIISGAIISPIIAPTIIFSLWSAIMAKAVRALLWINIAIIMFFADFNLLIFEVNPDDARVFLVYIPIVVLFTTIVVSNRRSGRVVNLAKSQKYGKIYSC